MAGRGRHATKPVFQQRYGGLTLARRRNANRKTPRRARAAYLLALQWRRAGESAATSPHPLRMSAGFLRDVLTSRSAKRLSQLASAMRIGHTSIALSASAVAAEDDSAAFLVSEEALVASLGRSALGRETDRGMVRAYLCGTKVAGVGYQEIVALHPTGVHGRLQPPAAQPPLLLQRTMLSLPTFAGATGDRMACGAAAVNGHGGR